MTPDILFDNFIITNDKYVADKFATDRYDEKKNLITVNCYNFDTVKKNFLLLRLKFFALLSSWVKKNIKETYGGDEEVSNNFLLVL